MKQTCRPAKNACIVVLLFSQRQSTDRFKSNDILELRAVSKEILRKVKEFADTTP